MKQGTATLAGFTFSEDKDFANGTEQGKSYALDARPVVDGTLSGEITVTEEDITALVDEIKSFVDNEITTIVVTGSKPATIDMGSYTNTSL